MNRKLWWAKLNSQSPRYHEWHEILGNDDVPLLGPFTVSTQLAGDTTDIYLLDWNTLDEEASGRLIEAVAKKFNAKAEEIEPDLDRDGFFPIRAADVAIFYDVRAFL